MKALGTNSKMSRPRLISELTRRPLYQYTDHEPASSSFCASTGPQSKYAISRGCAASVQSNIEIPPWYHACTITSRPGIGISDPLCATQFSLEVCGAGSL